MDSLEGKRAVVTGGNRGLGFGIVEALVARKAKVTVVGRDPETLAEVSRRLGVDVVRGDIVDEALANDVVKNVQPSILVLNAGATPKMEALDELTWDAFERTWQVDVKAGFHWIRAALRVPLAPGSRVLVGSSGAAVSGSPLSGGYAGAKRMLWIMAGYANGIAEQRGLRITFQAIVPRRMIGETDFGRAAALAYAKKRGITPEEFLAGFGAPLPPRQVGELVATILTDERHARGLAFGLKGDEGIVPFES